jgi:hypothetical protein
MIRNTPPAGLHCDIGSLLYSNLTKTDTASCLTVVHLRSVDGTN